MGVHITFVRSVELDEWTPDQLKIMTCSGNGNAASFFRSNGVRDLHIKVIVFLTGVAVCALAVHLRVTLMAHPRVVCRVRAQTDQKYNSAAARQYKVHLKKLLAADTPDSPVAAPKAAPAVNDLDFLMLGLSGGDGGGLQSSIVEPAKGGTCCALL